jgi:AcrR family transcriptional regulator
MAVGKSDRLQGVVDDPLAEDSDADWQRRVVGRSLRTAAERSVDRGMNLIRAAAAVLARSNGADITVQEVADEAGQSLRTLYQYFESKNDLLLAVFEEAMRTYAQLIDEAIADLDDPLERLAGAMLAAVRMPELSGSALDRGLIRLRVKLSETQPELVGRAQSAVTSLLLGLVEAAAAADRITVVDPEGATFDLVGITSFCLRGLGAEVPDDWHETVSARLRFPVPAAQNAIVSARRRTGSTAGRRASGK